MKNIIKLILGVLFLINHISANDTILQSDFENQTIHINVNSYKVLKFQKRIKNIQFTNSESLTAKFVDNKIAPLTTLKVYAKKVGNENAIVTFQDKSVSTVNFNIVQNIKSIIDVVKKIYPNIKITQVNESIVLEGKVRNNTDKKRIIDVLSKSGFDPEKNIIDLIEDENSTKMVRVKLYVVQIDNNRGQQLISEWQIGNFNDGKSSVSIIDSLAKTDLISELVNSTSLTGGITSLASRAGSAFDVDWTLNYLKQNNAVRIMNESTLVMQENKESSFNSGGTLFVEVTSTSAEGLPTSELKELEYGLNITMNINKLIDNKFIDFHASAKSDKLDWDNAIDGLPGLLGNNVTTNVIIKDGATIVLAGVLSTDNSKNEEKIPFLGDIPGLGMLFTSSIDADNTTDLVFFITPEIVDPRDNNQNELLHKKTNIIQTKDYRNQKDSMKIKEKDTTSKKEENSIFKNVFKAAESEKKLTPEQAHQKRVNEILGY